MKLKSGNVGLSVGVGALSLTYVVAAISLALKFLPLRVLDE